MSVEKNQKQPNGPNQTYTYLKVENIFQLYEAIAKQPNLWPIGDLVAGMLYLYSDDSSSTSTEVYIIYVKTKRGRDWLILKIAYPNL